VIGSITFTPERDLPRVLDPSRIRLWVSPNNGRYLPYGGPMRARRAGRRIVLDDLRVEQPFFAVEATGGPTYGFGNVLRDLVEVHDDAGARLPVTYAYVDRSVHYGEDWHESGFAMDVPGNALGAMDDYFWIDGGRPLACGLGLQRYLPGALCPAYPEVREWWMKHVDDCLAAGVDGLDIRIGSHNRTFDWAAYGFNKPVVDAFRARYGVDILREPFDLRAWRELRGEIYTGFLKEASARIRAHGKAVHVHVGGFMVPPDWHCWKETHFDWPTWMDERLMDEVTFMTSELRFGLVPRMAEAAREAGLRVNFRPYLNGLAKAANGRQRLSRIVREACEGGADGVIMYENAAFMSAARNGAAQVTCPWIVSGMRERARG
jgi:hypothetical protein